MRDQRVLDLLSGVITAQWLTLELLDQTGVLPRERAIRHFEDALEEMGPDLAADITAFPIRRLVKALSGAPDADPEEEGPRCWQPVVIAGGKDEEG